jgi:hypothetical protein
MLSDLLYNVNGMQSDAGSRHVLVETRRTFYLLILCKQLMASTTAMLGYPFPSILPIRESFKSRDTESREDQKSVCEFRTSVLPSSVSVFSDSDFGRPRGCRCMTGASRKHRYSKRAPHLQQTFPQPPAACNASQTRQKIR